MSTPETAIDTTTQADPSPWKEERTAQFWQMIGATKLASQLSAALTSQTLQALQRVRDEKLWADIGCESFRDFLDNHPGSPMSYDQFNRREKLLNAEGPEAFDLLNSVNAPHRTRQLLKGHIEVDGNEIKIGEERVRRDDGEAILSLLVKQEARLLEQQRTMAKQKKKLEKGAEDFERLKRQVRVANPTGTPTGQALLTAAGALTQLCKALESAPDEEKQLLKDQIFDLMRAKQLDLSVALGDLSKEEVQQVTATAEEISDDDLEGLES